MMLCFVLSMPNVGSWNGRWTGESNLYARVKSFTGKARTAEAESLANRHFYYNFGDGWGASVNVRPIAAAEARKVRKNSKGFAGYDWMIDSIIRHGEIRATIYGKDHEVVGYRNNAGQVVYTDGRPQSKVTIAVPY